MKNITLIIAFIIGTSFALSAQRGGTISSNTNSGFDNTTRGNSTISTKNRGGSSNYGRTGNGRPNSNANNNRPSNNGRGGGHHNNGHNNNGHHNSGHHNNGHHNNGHNGHHNNGHHNNGHNGHHNNGHHNNAHNSGHHNNGHHSNGHNGHHSNVNVVVSTGHHGHHYNSYCNYSNHNYGWNAVCITDFNIGCRSIRSCGYDSDRIRSAKRFVRNNYVSTHQIADIMMMFSFESTKLEFAKYAFHRTCDVQNYGVVFNHLGFNSSRRDLDCYIRDFQW